MVKTTIKVNDKKLSEALGILPLGYEEFVYEGEYNNSYTPPWNKGMKGVSEDTRQRMSDAQKGKIISEETRQKLSLFNKGKTLTEEHKKKIGKANSISKKGGVPWNKGKKHTLNKRQKSKMALWYEITYPDNKKEIVYNLALWCEKNNISKSNMCLVANGKKEHFKNFKCRKVNG